MNSKALKWMLKNYDKRFNQLLMLLDININVIRSVISFILFKLLFIFDESTLLQ